jgi:hypothetical protein
MRHLVLLALAAAPVVAGCGKAPVGEDPSLIFDRVWLEREPRDPKDYVHAAYLIPRPALGVFQRGSSYDFRTERFDHQRDGGALTLTFPQSGRSAKITFTITACTDVPPFDLCLDLSDNPWEPSRDGAAGGSGPKRFRSIRAPEDDATARRLKAALGPR